MSFKFLAKQLPSEHIAQRRFSPYKKASMVIQHLDKAKFNPEPFSLDKPLLSQAKAGSLCSDSRELKIHSLTPLSRLSEKIQQKIEIINSFNNLSECKTFKIKKKNCSGQSPKALKRRLLVKQDKKNYHLLVNQAFNERLPKKESLVTETGESITKTRQQSRCKSQDKIISTRASERWDFTRDFQTFELVLRPEGVRKEKISVKNREKNRKSEGFKDWPKFMNRLVKKTLDFNVELKDLISVSPILDLNKCPGFN